MTELVRNSAMRLRRFDQSQDHGIPGLRTKRQAPYPTTTGQSIRRKPQRPFRVRGFRRNYWGFPTGIASPTSTVTIAARTFNPAVVGLEDNKVWKRVEIYVTGL